MTSADPLITATLRRAAAARANESRFFDFAMRSEEAGNAALRIAAHQQLQNEFVLFYQYCVVRAFTGSSKTFGMMSLLLHVIGSDPTERIMVISAAEDQSKKVVNGVRSYIEKSPEVRLVFPELRPSSQQGDPWSQTSITVERGMSVRDPTMAALSYETGRVLGGRATWILIDDILNSENTATVEQRRKLNNWVQNNVLTRRGARDLRITVTNAPWHPGDPSGQSDDKGDLTYALARLGWAVLNMDAYGNIWFENADAFDSDLIRPSDTEPRPGELDRFRLVAHDTPEYARSNGIALDPSVTEWRDRNDEIPLWPEVWPRSKIEEQRRVMTELAHQQSYSLKVRDDATSHVKIEWIEKCKKHAKENGVTQLEAAYSGGLPVVTGIDPAFSKKKKSDLSALFTVAFLPNGFRQILDIQAGKWSGVELKTRIANTIARYNSIAYVEGNSAQGWMKDWLLEQKIDTPVRSLVTTGKRKWDHQTGLESIFIEIENGAWLIPNVDGLVDPVVQDWINELLFYQRGKHTGDRMMAMWIAREGARLSKITRGPQLPPEGATGISSLHAR
jgi:hypothetical protein